LIESFENDILPQSSALSNILFQNHNISERACERAANIFIENANNLGFLRDEGMLILKKNSSISDFEDVKIEDIETIVEDENKFSKVQYIKNNFDNEPNEVATLVLNDTEKNENSQKEKSVTFSDVNQNDIVINVLLKNRRTAQIILPKDAKSSDLDTITNWINMMRQSFD